jgi:hypothetical protein
MIASFLLSDGHQKNKAIFHMMNEEGSFPRLLELIQTRKGSDGEDGSRLHRIIMDLLYEMSRIQRVRIEDLGRFLLFLTAQLNAGSDKPKRPLLLNI